MFAIIKTQNEEYEVLTKFVDVDPKKVAEIRGLISANFGVGTVGLVRTESGELDALCVEPNSIEEIEFELAKFFRKGGKQNSPEEEKVALLVDRWATKNELSWREIRKNLCRIKTCGITVFYTDEELIFAVDSHRNLCYLAG